MLQTSKANDRTTGVLLHPSALPCSPVCGSFGEPARRWLEALARHGIGVWQMLPLSPTDGSGSPYSSPSSFALNPWFLDARDLVADGFISLQQFDALPGAEASQKFSSSLDFALAEQRSHVLGEALCQSWLTQREDSKAGFEHWCRQQSWLDDHAAFVELKRQHQGRPWWTWSKPLALHQPAALRQWQNQHKRQLLQHRLVQWHLDRQLQMLRRQAADLGVVLFGDLPFYVAHDSADVWSQRGLFSLKPDGSLEKQSGVPPDYFSSSGQLWGTPVYRWWRHRLTRFRWWRMRLKRQWQQVDLLRLDHFRALSAYWDVPGSDQTAEHGKWQPSPGLQLLKYLKRDCGGSLPLVAEDLGVITKDVESLRDCFDLPGMKILQFAFDGNENNPYLPENIVGENWVVYTGTHDNPTTLGWWQNLDFDTRNRVEDCLKIEVSDPGWQLLDIGLASKAYLVIAPLQDLLHLDDQARFNTPGTVVGNWCWRLSDFDQLLEDALLGYGERSTLWGRCLKGASGLRTKQGLDK